MKKRNEKFVPVHEFFEAEELIQITRDLPTAIKTLELLNVYVRNNLMMQKKKDEYLKFSDYLFEFTNQLSFMNLPYKNENNK